MSPAESFGKTPTPCDALVCPFPGLRPFEGAEARFYFGREKQRDECVRRLQERRFLAVVGSSGSGKSSLIRAGLLPALDRGLLRGADERWRYISMRPGPDPMVALARALAGSRTQANPVEIERKLRSSSRGLAEAVEMLFGDDQSNVLLFVDQFEELFRLGKEQQTPDRWRVERVAFVRALLGARESVDVPMYIVTTMRTDFLEDCTFIPDLPEALNAGQFLIPELTREQLETAIVEPAARLGVQMSRALLRRALSDAALVKDSLPALQHALMRTWRNWQNKAELGQASSNRIEIDLYNEIGTAREAIDQHGEEVLANLGPAAIPVAKLVFQRLTSTNADGKVTRSPTSLETLVELASANCVTDAETEVRRVLDAFRADDCRFIMPPPDERLESSEVDISHEAVCRVWKRLAGSGLKQDGWIPEEHRNRRLYARLFESAELKRNQQGQLLDQESLVLMEEWWNRFRPTPEWTNRYHVFDDEAQAIIEQAQKQLLSLEGVDSEGRENERKAIQERCRARLEGWHRVQLEQVHAYLKESHEAKAAAERLKAELQIARARKTKWVIASVMGALVVAALLLGQHIRVRKLNGEIDAVESERAEILRQKDLLGESVKQLMAKVEGENAAFRDAREKAQKAIVEAAKAEAEATRAEAERNQSYERLEQTERKLVEARKNEKAARKRAHEARNEADITNYLLRESVIAAPK